MAPLEWLTAEREEVAPMPESRGQNLIKQLFRETCTWLRSHQVEGIRAEDANTLLAAAEAAEAGDMFRALETLGSVSEPENVEERMKAAMASETHGRRIVHPVQNLLALLSVAKDPERAEGARSGIRVRLDSLTLGSLALDPDEEHHESTSPIADPNRIPRLW
jgi:cation diffusion facilitator CzcD-associated flavoprotein CzcO